MKTCITGILKLMLLAACAASGLTGAAQAAYVEVIADPAYGAAYPGLGWRATAGLYIPDACLQRYSDRFDADRFDLATGPAPGAITPEPCTGATPADTPELRDVRVYFYALAAPAIDLETISVGTYTADAPPAVADVNGLTQELVQIAIDGDVSVDLTSSFPHLRIDDFTTSESFQFTASNPLLGGTRIFSLSFDRFTGAQLTEYVLEGNPSVAGRSSFAEVRISRPISDGDYDGHVPSPGSAALALAALVALAATRCRRTAG